MQTCLQAKAHKTFELRAHRRRAACPLYIHRLFPLFNQLA
jgi:hypothetical protein